MAKIKCPKFECSGVVVSREKPVIPIENKYATLSEVECSQCGKRYYQLKSLVEVRIENGTVNTYPFRN